MIVGLCWIVGSYMLGIALVHALIRGRDAQTHHRAPIHYVLLTRNNQAHIEWVLRYLQIQSMWKGRPIRITLADAGSTDDTLEIASRFMRWVPVRIRQVDENDTSSWTDGSPDTIIYIPMRDGEEWAKLPMVP